jgi:predicted transcriptional regulator
MQDEISRMPDEQEETAQKGVLGLLLALDSQRPWSVAEVERELGEHISTVDAVASLHAAGLVHRCGEFVFATRAALRLDRLSL